VKKTKEGSIDKIAEGETVRSYCLLGTTLSPELFNFSLIIGIQATILRQVAIKSTPPTTKQF